jgi:hypothetical protein
MGVSVRARAFQALFDLAPRLRKALERGVKIRWIINKPFDRNEVPTVLNVVSDSERFELRSAPFNPVKTFSIYDKARVIVVANPKLGYVQSPALWTNSASLVDLAQHYFDVLWNKTAKSEINFTQKKEP